MKLDCSTYPGFNVRPGFSPSVTTVEMTVEQEMRKYI